MIIELVVAFVLVLVVSSVVYLFGRLLSAKSVRGGDGKSAYACGEKTSFGKLKINVSHYKYLVYFVILDSSVLLSAFASLTLRMANALLFIVYLLIVLMSGLLLLEGGDH
jgi:NADH:ubiquinone oxidoreductase subunit 3 (subunit A)